MVQSQQITYAIDTLWLHSLFFAFNIFFVVLSICSCRIWFYFFHADFIEALLLWSFWFIINILKHSGEHYGNNEKTHPCSRKWKQCRSEKWSKKWNEKRTDNKRFYAGAVCSTFTHCFAAIYYLKHKEYFCMFSYHSPPYKNKQCSILLFDVLFSVFFNAFNVFSNL